MYQNSYNKVAQFQHKVAQLKAAQKQKKTLPKHRRYTVTLQSTIPPRKMAAYIRLALTDYFEKSHRRVKINNIKVHLEPIE